MLRSFSTARAAAASLLLLIAAQGCARDDKPPAQAAAPDEKQLMDRGLQQLYKSSDPVGAEQTFRAILARNASHYGARYQLAVALDRGGRPSEARTEWSQVVQQAQTFNDSATLRTARARLAAPDTSSAQEMMVLGLDLLYRQNNPTAAADQFRKVLQKNPAHYGATYQLATALDKAGRQSEARPLWVKVLGMATTYKDEQTAATARGKLR